MSIIRDFVRHQQLWFFMRFRGIKKNILASQFYQRYT